MPPNVKSAACSLEAENNSQDNKLLETNATASKDLPDTTLTKVDQYFSEQSEEPKCSGKKSFDTVSNIEKEQFSYQFSKNTKLSVKNTSLASIITINVKSAACQYDAENKMLDDKVLETNVTAYEASPDIKVKRKQCLDTDSNLEKEQFSDQFSKKAKPSVKYRHPLNFTVLIYAVLNIRSL